MSFQETEEKSEILKLVSLFQIIVCCLGHECSLSTETLSGGGAAGPSRLVLCSMDVGKQGQCRCSAVSVHKSH